MEIARDAGIPVLFSANAFMVRDKHEDVIRVRYPDPRQFGNLNAALDSAGFVAASHYRGYPWSIEQYLNLVQSYDWAWYSSMDLCVEPEITGSQVEVMFRVAETCRLHGELRKAAGNRGIRPPIPVLQGWTPAQYLWCVDHYPLVTWPELIGVGSMCRRNVHGDVGVLAVVDALDAVLPAHTKFHLFGVKGKALELIGQHPRIHSVDSMAWDFAARRDHPTGRTMDLRGQYMADWVKRNQHAAVNSLHHTPSLLPPEVERVNRKLGEWLDLITSNEIEGPDARAYALQGCDLDILEDEEEDADVEGMRLS